MLFIKSFEHATATRRSRILGEGIRSVALHHNRLIGTSPGGGAHDKGTLWAFDLDTREISKLHDFGGVIVPEPSALVRVLTALSLPLTRRQRRRRSH